METVKEENEKKKEYLKQYGKALRQEKRIEEELERLKLDRMLPGALAADGMPKSSSLSDLSDYMAKIDELERKPSTHFPSIHSFSGSAWICFALNNISLFICASAFLSCTSEFLFLSSLHTSDDCIQT